MRRIENGYELSTGRIFYANRGLIGLSPSLDEVSEGYDGHVRVDSYDDPWTVKEKRELADFMIGLWTQFGGGF